MSLPTPLVSVQWLRQHLHDLDLVIADCRFTMADVEAGHRAYAESHLPGAVYFHLDDDLSGPVGVHGGRHPLPDPDLFPAKLGQAGVADGINVVAYDWTGEHAARFWWLLKWLGHDQVAVLDGGWRALLEGGLPTTAERAVPVARAFAPRLRNEMTAGMKAVRERSSDMLVVDARAPERFAGQPNPLDPKPGHIPGAVNRFWKESLRPDGTWRPAEEQAARFADLPDPAGTIHSCGSGVTACANLLAMEIAGIRGARLYPGSWSDWCSYEVNPVEK